MAADYKSAASKVNQMLLLDLQSSGSNETHIPRKIHRKPKRPAGFYIQRFY
jgi:hypothetical protein